MGAGVAERADVGRGCGCRSRRPARCRRGSRGASRAVSAMSIVKVREVAVVDADQRARRRRPRASASRLVVDLDQRVEPVARAPSASRSAQLARRRARRRSAAPHRRRRRAPRRPGTGRSMKSLRRSGSATAARTAARNARSPSKKCRSVSTEIAAAPAAAYSRAIVGRVGARPDRPGRRRRALDLGEHAHRRHRRPAQRAGEPAGRPGRARPRASTPRADARRAPPRPRRACGEDLVEDAARAHGRGSAARLG